MKERPILFSGEMVRAILEGRKTMTRRVMKDIPTDGLVYDASEKSRRVHGAYHGFHPQNSNCASSHSEFFLCPYGEVGDRLWVKEAHYAFGHWEHIGQTKTGKKKWGFVYDGKQVVFDAPKNWFSSRSKVAPSDPAWYKRNSLFMPKWAARTWLERTETRVDRLQDISQDDVKREGVKTSTGAGMIEGETCYHFTTNSGYMRGHRGAVLAFKDLWCSINGKESWDANPFLWVIGFKKLNGGAK